MYYAATDLEARVCAGQPVTVVGGGNSAGQAAIYLAQRGCKVTIVIRGDDLTSSMSSYLIDRIDAAADITVVPRTQVVELHGDASLTEITLETGTPDDAATLADAGRVIPCFGMFSFIGAAPFTEWLAGVVELDDHGFVMTDRDVTTLVCTGVDLLPFETSQPGVFADRRRASRLDEARRRGRRRGFERDPVGARPPRPVAGDAVGGSVRPLVRVARRHSRFDAQ